MSRTMTLLSLRALALAITVLVLSGTQGHAIADAGDEICEPLFRQVGAIPGRPSCRAIAAGAPVGLANYFCTAGPARIRRFCGPAPTLIGFFNGVWNTGDDAEQSLARLRQEYGSTFRGTPLVYELFHNRTGCEESRGCPADVAEVFAQRQAELQGVTQQRWEIFWEMINNRDQQADSLTSAIRSGLATASAFIRFIDAMRAEISNAFLGLAGELGRTASTIPDLREHAQKLAGVLRNDVVAGAVLVAHSQGNLFVNAAHDIVKAAVPQSQIKVAHVAPASPTLRGDYVLADIDTVINLLRIPRATAVPPVNIILPLSAADASGHTLEGTYLDTTRPAYARVRAMIDDALASLVTDER